METDRKWNPLVIFELVVGLAAAILFLVSMSLNFVEPAGGGESRIANAYASLAAMAGLWAVLWLLLLVDAFRAPRFPGLSVAAMLLLPVAAVASFLATDYPHDLLCRLSLPAMPLSFGAYALLPRSPPRAGRVLVLAANAALIAYLTLKFLS